MTIMQHGFRSGSLAVPETAIDVEARLIEAVRVFDRLEGATGRRWASDGPWYLSRLSNVEAWIRDMEHLQLGEAIARAVRSPRPDRDMISRAEEAAGWLVLVAERDRRLVLLAVRCLAAGYARVPWLKVVRVLRAGGMGTARGIAMRYTRALERLARELPARERQMRAGISRQAL